MVKSCSAHKEHGASMHKKGVDLAVIVTDGRYSGALPLLPAPVSSTMVTLSQSKGMHALEGALMRLESIHRSPGDAHSVDT